MKDKASYLSETSPSVIVPSPLFADLDGATIALIVAHLTEEVWPAGHVVFEEYAPGDTLYIIVDGQVQISRTFQNGAQRVIREMGPGEFFGEMALLEDTPRSARVSTVTATTFLAVTRQRFNTLIEQHPAVAINFLKAISAQLRQQYQEQAVLLEEKQALVEALAAKNAALEQALAELRAALAPSPSTNASNAIWKLPVRSSNRCFPPRFHRLRACACMRLRCQPRGSGEIFMMLYA